MTADERINRLIECVGSPVMVVHNTQETEDERVISTMLNKKRIVDSDFGGSEAKYIQHLVDTIDRLEVALSNTILQRDQLLMDIKNIAVDYGQCLFCKHAGSDLDDGFYEECVNNNYNHWEWRGVEDNANEGD